MLAQYVNDRPYVASSFLSVAIAQVYGSALSGNCREKPELAEEPLPLVARIAVLPCRRGGEAFLRRLFEPLGYAITATRHALDPKFPEWGESPYFTVELAATVRLADLLSHLYVLVPVLDEEKHYWVSHDEVESSAARRGLARDAPEKEQIAARYLKRGEAREGWRRWRPTMAADPEEAAADNDLAEERLEAKVSLHERRLAAVLAVLQESARGVLDLGCGEGSFSGCSRRIRGSRRSRA